MKNIYTNGSFLKLICLKGEGEKTAYFLNLNNLELIKGVNTVWNMDTKTVSWAWGGYNGHIMQNVKDEAL